MNDRTDKWITCGVVPLVFLLLYALTAQRGVSWQDSGEFHYRVLATDCLWNPGIARAHPLYILGASLMAACAPVPLKFYAITFFSGVGMATALAFLAMILWRLTANRWATLAATFTLGLSHMCWWLSAMAEVYTWSLAFLMIELFCLLIICLRKPKVALPWWLALAFLNGMNASIHNFAFLNLPVYGALFIASRKGIRAAAACAIAWLAGAGLLVCLFCAEIRAQTFAVAFKSLLFGYDYENVVLGKGPINWKLAIANLALASVSFASPCWFFMTRNVRTLRDYVAFKRCLLALTCIHFVFWLRYFVPDQATFILPTLGLCAVWLGIGYATARRSRTAHAALLAIGITCQLALPPVLCVIASRCGVMQARSLPFRQDIPYWLLPWKHNETSAQQFVDTVEDMLHDHDVLIPDSTSAGPLMATEALRKTPSVWRLVLPWSGGTSEELLALTRQPDTRVFVVSPVAGYTPAVLLDTKRFEPEGILYRVLEKP